MAAVTEIFRDAQALAEFSNLEPQDVEAFRRNYPDFVPQAWWDYETEHKDSRGVVFAPPSKQWQFNQRRLREVWKSRFASGIGSIIDLTMSVFDPNGLMDLTLFPALGHRPLFATPAEMPYHSYPHQKAVLYLFENPWRARFCAECNKRFVAAEPKNKYCSEVCSHENRNRQKREWFAEHGRQQRAARNAKAKRIAGAARRGRK